MPGSLAEASSTPGWGATVSVLGSLPKSQARRLAKKFSGLPMPVVDGKVAFGVGVAVARGVRVGRVVRGRSTMRSVKNGRL